MGQKFIKLSNFRRRQTVCGYILVGVSFLLLTLLTVKTFAPQVETDAASQTASQTVGPYTMSMANDSAVTINITPTASQTVYSASNNLTVNNTCPSGATIKMTVNSTTSNALTRTATNSDSLTKTIAATSGSSLQNNSWGYSINNGTNYYPVPLKNGTAATIYDASAAQSSNLNVPVLFGVKTDNNLPSGAYTNSVIYTMTPKSGCLTYSLAWNLNGGTGKSGASYTTANVNWGTTYNLNNYTPTKSGYTFTGWSNGSSTFTGSETSANPNPNNAASITMTAQWRDDHTIPTSSCTGSYGRQVNVNLAVNGTQDFDYRGSVDCAYLQKAGRYKLEVWGAQGGLISAATSDQCNKACGSHDGGYGGYSYGEISAETNSSLYIAVGGKGSRSTTNTSGGISSGGYNGGGDSGANYSSNYNTSGAGGGGATHIASVTGALSSLSSATNRAKVLIVAGGGGGTGNGWNRSDMIGGAGGGYIGGIGTSDNQEYGGYGGTQTGGGQIGQNRSETESITGTTGSFGKGGNGNSNQNAASGAGGGGGWYGGGGGGTGRSSGGSSGGGGSGYINTTLLRSYRMYCYSSSNSYTPSSNLSTYNKGYCGTSTSYYTYGTTSIGHAVSNYANTGNGYARITYLGT